MGFLNQYKGLRKENYVLSFGRLVTGLGSMIWPMMTLILSRKMGVDAGEISWLLAGAMIVMAPVTYIGGKIADRYDKKLLIVLLDLISVLCFVTCAFIPMSWISIGLLFIGSLAQNMEFPAYNALTADITLTADRDRAYSLSYLCANLGLVLSPTIAGILFRDYLWLAFLINGLSILCSSVLIFLLVKDTAPALETGSESVYQTDRRGESMRHILSENKTVLFFIIAMAGFDATYSMQSYLMPLDLTMIHGDSGAVIYGSITSINCIVVVLFTPVITARWGMRSEPDRLAAGGALVVAGLAVFMLFEGRIPMYYASMILLTWGEIFAVTAQNPYLSRRIPSSHRGRINGVFTLVKTLTTSLFQILVGILYSGRGSVFAWVTVLLMGGLSILVMLLVRRSDPREYPNLYPGASA